MISGFILRFEEGFVVVEQINGTMIKINRSRIPAFARTGDFIEGESESANFHIDFSITEKKRKEVLLMADMLFE